MKAGITSSILAHATLLTLGIVSLAAPPKLNVPDIEALPIDIIPIEELTKTIEGARKADRKPIPTPKKTAPLPKPKPAVNVGESQIDVKADAPKVVKAPPVKKVEAPTPKLAPAPVKEETPVPTPELAAENKPKTDIAMLLKESESIEPDKPVEEVFEKLPDRVAAPKPRPQKPKPDTAQTTKRKTEPKVAAKPVKKADDVKKKIDDIKAVLDKAKASAGGAKASQQEAALGAKKSNNDSKLSQNELDALRSSLEGCFNAGDLPGHQDAASMTARVTFKLTRSGEVDGRVKAKVSGTSGATRGVFSRRVKNAILDCAPYRLPAEKYDTWSEVVVNFSLKDLL